MQSRCRSARNCDMGVCQAAFKRLLMRLDQRAVNPSAIVVVSLLQFCETRSLKPHTKVPG